MKRENELLKNTVILGIGQFFPKIIAIATLPIITGQLTRNEYGIYDLISTLVMLLLPIATLQIQSAAFRFLIDYRGNVQKSKSIITNILTVTIPVSIIMSLFIMLFMYKCDTSIRIVTGLYFFADITYITVSQISRGLGMNKVYSISAGVVSIVNGIGIILSVQLIKVGLFGVILSLFFANIFASLYVIHQTSLISYFDTKETSLLTIRSLISYSWPMIPNNLSNWVLSLSDRLVITAFLGVGANAVYAVANKIPNLLSVAQAVFTMAWQENASIAIKDSDADRYFTEMFDRIFTMMVSFAAGLIGFTPIMFKLLIRGNYAEAYVQMPILILGLFFYCMAAFQGGIYVAHKRTKSVGITTVAAAIVNLTVDLVLVKFIGITAGSLSTLIAYFMLYLFRMVDSLKFQPIKYNIKKQIISFIFISGMLFLCYLQDFYINIINNCIGILAFCYLNRNLFTNILNKMLTAIKNKYTYGS